MFLKNLLLLAQNFYGLDPCHYFSSPKLSWDAMLKMTEINQKKYQTSASALSDCNGTRTYNHLVRKRTLNHLAELTK